MQGGKRGDGRLKKIATGSDNNAEVNARLTLQMIDHVTTMIAAVLFCQMAAIRVAGIHGDLALRFGQDVGHQLGIECPG